MKDETLLILAGGAVLLGYVVIKNLPNITKAATSTVASIPGAAAAGIIEGTAAGLRDVTVAPFQAVNILGNFKMPTALVNQMPNIVAYKSPAATILPAVIRAAAFPRWL